jgi:hypothetical protein
VKDRDQRKSDQGGREGAAENDNDGVIGKVHSEIAAHEDDRRNDDRSANETQTGRDIHGRVYPQRDARAARDGTPDKLARPT